MRVRGEVDDFFVRLCIGLAGIDLSFFTEAHAMLCFGFVVKSALVMR